MDNPLFIGAIQFAVLLMSLSVHESAHAWTADRLGDPTARLLGRVSLNPLVHMDLLGTVILPLIGMFTGFMFGWAKPVPVNLSKLRNPSRDHMLVAAAGPASNLVLAAGMFVVLFAIKAFAPAMIDQVVHQEIPRGDFPVLGPLAMLAFYGLFINVILAIFNLIPVAPLDGGTVLAGFLPRSLSWVEDGMRSYGIMILVVLLYWDVPRELYMPALRFVQSFLIL